LHMHVSRDILTWGTRTDLCMYVVHAQIWIRRTAAQICAQI